MRGTPGRKLRRLRWVGLGLLCCAVLATLPGSAGARPEKVRAGHSYYSDTAVREGPVPDLGPEKNYEEVYRHYTYFEAVYDGAGRVVRFLEYRRGEVVRDERYRYAPDGALLAEGAPPPEAPPDPAGAPGDPIREGNPARPNPQEEP